MIDLGLTQLKNIAEPVRVYLFEVGKPAQAKPVEPIKPLTQKKRPMLASMVLGVVLLMVIAAVGAWYLRARQKQAVIVNAPAHLSIVVLPFTGRERWDIARPIADELLTVAQRLDDRALLLEAHHAMCPTTLWVGDPQEARTHGEQRMALYDREQHQSLAFLFGNHDPGVYCSMHSAMALWFLGYSQKAVERSRTASVRHWRFSAGKSASRLRSTRRGARILATSTS